MIEAFYFGPDGQRIFGSYHPPAGIGTGVLTVICPPLFNEYMRTHAMLRDLAHSLAERGQHVLRFDYCGIGDSFGDLEEASTSDWKVDINAAVSEGGALAGSRDVRVLGVRASALLACWSLGNSTDVQRMVLWDPVLNGGDYLRALRRMHVELIERRSYSSDNAGDETSHEYAGYRLSARMANELRLLDDRCYLNVPMEKLRIVSTQPATTFPLRGVPCALADCPCEWERELDNLLTPRPVLDRLIECLTMI